MKLLFIISSLLIISINTIAQNKVIDKVVAQIGDNIILLSELQNQKLQMENSGDSIPENALCMILEQAMFQNLLLAQAKVDSILVSDEQVDAEMENRLRVIERQIGSREKLEEFYGKSTTQIKEEFRTQIKDRLLAQEMERTITSTVSVTPKEVKVFYNNIHQDSIPYINSKLSFQQIVIYPEITKTDKKIAYDQLKEIRANILNGKSFETQARLHSMDPGSASQGGKIEATKGMMVPQFESTLFNLQVGEVSDIFETDYGYHIMKLIDRKGDDYTCLHILIVPEFSNDAISLAANKMDSCYRELKSGSITWDQAVLKYSNDESTKQNKGIITNPITGEQTWDMEDLNQVDQEIFLLTDALEKGDYSAPNLYMNYFERKQGIRMVRLLDRSEPHKANLKDDYTLIKMAAENQKREKTIKDWVQSKISSYYIRIDESFQNCSFEYRWVKTL
jgi:peptidyl-prolyl cis-trans isomerase SurA